MRNANEIRADLEGVFATEGFTIGEITPSDIKLLISGWVFDEPDMILAGLLYLNSHS